MSVAISRGSKRSERAASPESHANRPGRKAVRFAHADFCTGRGRQWQWQDERSGVGGYLDLILTDSVSMKQGAVSSSSVPPFSFLQSTEKQTLIYRYTRYRVHSFLGRSAAGRQERCFGASCFDHTQTE